MSKTQFTIPPGSQIIEMQRVFNAPRPRVFAAYTDPKLIPEWWGPRRFTTLVERMEVKKGGVWRYVQRSNDADALAFNGVYHEIVAPERIITTFEFEGWAGNVCLIITTFIEQGRQTFLKELSVYPSVEARDATVAAGMEGGASEALERFAEVLAKVQ